MVEEYYMRQNEECMNPRNLTRAPSNDTLREDHSIRYSLKDYSSLIPKKSNDIKLHEQELSSYNSPTAKTFGGANTSDFFPRGASPVICCNWSRLNDVFCIVSASRTVMLLRVIGLMIMFSLFQNFLETPTSDINSSNLPSMDSFTSIQAHSKRTPLKLSNSTVSNNKAISLPIYSPNWLQGSRISNIEEDIDFTISQILDAEKVIKQSGTDNVLFDATVCHKDSPVRTFLLQKNITDDVQQWVSILIYLGLHMWHHNPAKEEALNRRKQRNSKNFADFNHSYDFECPNAKYLVTSLPDIGLGASFRASAIYYLLLGIATNRITVFLGNVQSKILPEEITKPYLLGGFCERGDFQCSFLPTTPCVFLLEDLEQNLITLPSQLERQVRTKGVLRDSNIVNSKYLFIPMKAKNFKDMGIGKKIAKRIASILQPTIDQIQSKELDGNQNVIKEALRRIRERNFRFGRETEASEIYVPFRQAALLYMLRLNRKMKDEVNAGVMVSLPENWNSAKSLGFPIRGSDKCRRESTCLSFDSYIDLAHQQIKEYFPMDPYNVSLIITTEDSKIAEMSKNFTSSKFKIVMNTNDVLQNSGRPSTFKFKRQARNIMISSLVAIKLQLLSRHMIGNCCSNFYLLLRDLQNFGCGMALESACLQDALEERFHIQCMWDRTKDEAPEVGMNISLESGISTPN
jgi:hypothetical protein